MKDFYFYIILFLFILNFVFLVALANFIVRLAEGIDKILSLDFDENNKQNKNNKIQEDKGLIDL